MTATSEGPDQLRPGDPDEVTGVGMTGRADLQQRVMRGSMATALHVVVSVPVALVVSAIVARVLGPAAYGRLAYLSIAIALAIAFTDLGMPMAMVQWGAAAEAAGDTADAQHLLRGSAGYRLYVQLPLLAVFGLVLVHGEPAWVAQTYLVALVLTVGSAGATLALTLQNRSASLAVVATIGSLLVQFAALGTALVSRAPGPVWAVRLLLSAVFPLLSFIALDRGYWRAAILPRLPRMPAGFWRYALLMWSGGLLTLLVYSRSEIFVLKFFGQNEELGLFALAFGLSQQLTTPLDAMLGPLLPASAALLSAHPEQARVALERGVRFSALLAGAIAAVILPAGYFVIPSVFGPQFGRVSSMFVVLGLVSTMQSVCHPVNALLVARRKAKTILAISAGTLTVDLGLAVALVPSFGAWGAVIANAGGQLVSIWFFVRAELRAQGIGVWEGLASATSWALSTVAFGVAMLAGRLLSPGPALVNAGFVALVGAGVYLALLRGIGGVLTEGDRNALLLALPARVRPSLARALRLVAVRPAQQAEA